MLRRVTTLALMSGVLCGACLLGALGSRSFASQPPLVSLSPIGNFYEPVQVTTAPGEPNLLFVTEQQGRIIALRNGVKVERPFLDIHDLVGFDNHGAEPGMLAVAFSPGYAKNRRFFVSYTDLDGNIRVEEFTRSRTSHLRARRKGRRKVLVINHPDHEPYQRNHYAGEMDFDSKGNLLVSTGDGGGGGDPGEKAQNPHSLLGKLLRVRPTSRRSKAPYAVPAGNPFVGAAGRDEIYSLGFRNPWRFQLRRPNRDELVLGDVGQDTWEEINLVSLRDARGANFGWDDFEGTHPYEATVPPSHYQPPIYDYEHDGPAGNCAVSGVSFANGIGVPSLEDSIIFGDFCAGELQALTLHEGQRPDVTDLGVNVPYMTSISHAHGNLYVAALDGTVYRLGPAG